MDQIAIFHDLCEPKAVLEVSESTTFRRINILELCKTAADTCRRVDSHESVPCPISVYLVARRPVCIVETLDDFRTQNVVTARNVKTGFLVEG